MPTSFGSLVEGDTFDFVNPHVISNSFFDKCVKVSPRKYKSLSTGSVYRIGTINAPVFNVDKKDAVSVAKALENIAKEHLHIETLEVQNRDSLDFHEVAVWNVSAALAAAYRLGKDPK